MDCDDIDVESYRTHGWINLPEVLSPDIAIQLRERGALLLNDGRNVEGKADAYRGGKNLGEDPLKFALLDAPSQQDDLFADVIRTGGLGTVAAQLMGVHSVRLFKDVLLVKEGGPDNRPTPIHQDFPFWPLDRSNALTIWVALCKVSPDMGSLRFYDRSHTWGLLGSHIPPSSPIEGRHRDLLERHKPTDPHALKPGHATAHNSLTVHLAAPNHTTRDRVAWVVSFMDADSIYTGAAYRVTDDLGLAPNSLLDHERFPRVPTES